MIAQARVAPLARQRLATATPGSPVDGRAICTPSGSFSASLLNELSRGSDHSKAISYLIAGKTHDPTDSVSLPTSGRPSVSE